MHNALTSDLTEPITFSSSAFINTLSIIYTTISICASVMPRVVVEERQHGYGAAQTQLLIRKILLGGLVGFTLLGVILFRILSLKRRNEKLQNEKKQMALEKQATELEMQTLRAQMRPHFIFNSLNSINQWLHDQALNASETKSISFSLLKM